MDAMGILEDAAKGAAAGSIVPGIGTTIGAAGAVAMDLAPDIGRWLFGPGAAETVTQVTAAVAAVTGTPDPQAQVAALEDPAKASALRVQLLAIAAQREAAAEAARHADLVASLADVASARSQTVALAVAHSKLAWATPAVSIAVLAMFIGAMLLVLVHGIAPGSESIAQVLLGTLSAMATAVVSYWVGSSAGSRSKDQTLSDQSTMLANSIQVK